jgi:hypothetical protein
MARSRFFRAGLPTLLTLAALAATACTATTASTPTTPAAPAAAQTKPGEVSAGMQIGTAPAAPAGWAPPARITPVDPVPGMFKSVGDMPAQPGAKVRVFFLGMQW